MLGPDMNTELHAGPIQKMCGAGSVPCPDLRENLTSLVATQHVFRTFSGYACVAWPMGDMEKRLETCWVAIEPSVNTHVYLFLAIVLKLT